MTGNGESTQPQYSEQWAVIVDRKEYVLNEKEIEILRGADQSGMRGMIWFKDFAISIPHISSIYLNDRRIKLQFESPKEVEQNEEEKQRIEKLKEQIKQKVKTF